MNRCSRTAALAVVLLPCMVFLFSNLVDAQDLPRERVFSQSKAAVDKALKQLQSSTSGRLPVLEGFVVPSDRPLERFQRGYYQCNVDVAPATTGGTVVRVRAKITAWYADPADSKSGYQVLPSNGRLESDLLDRLAEALGIPASPPASATGNAAVSPRSKNEAGASSPMHGATTPASTTASLFKLENPVRAGTATSPATQKAVADKHMEELTKEAKGLEEILHNQAHPDNLVAVKKSGTPVLASPSEGGKVLFLATAEDEFEILDTNANWVHVRISGLSRAWIRRSSLEMPEGSASSARRQEVASEPTKLAHFQVKDEQTATFPGTWEPLQGKTVKILTVQEARGSSETGAVSRSDFAKSLFEKEYAELTQSSSTAAGVVLIFDSEDGGMAAATLATLQQWKAGTLSDQAFWRRCFLDPPEILGSKAGD